MSENMNVPNNNEIEKALREFEEKARAEELQEAPEVVKHADASKMALWVMKLSGGAIKEEKHAEYILIGFAVLVMVFSISLFFNSGGGSRSTSTDKEVMDIILQKASKQ